ncbi:MAG: B12-binding domain-containing radical SAM protein [Oscillospiraceae bacterium]|nr:B12-binding domain-containing radical SAM protein [Oscillospiraceae bacterium]
MNGKTIMLVAFYNKKALGVRYLEGALRARGYRVHVVFFKDFNSIHPERVTEAELKLLVEEIRKHEPMMIGLSVMSSMYLDTVNSVIETIQENCTAPVVCGGAYATMFPNYFLDKGVPFVIRSDGEIAICRLADALARGEDPSGIPSLCSMKDGAAQINEIGDILNEIDGYGLPTIECESACFIEHDSMVEGDPQKGTLSYEVIASRGCPFTCSYCCCSNLRKLLPAGIKGVRTRSVKSVIDELILAKQKCKKIVFVHFYDEIFPNLPGWVDEFVVEYKKHIDLPFTIWSHPKAIDPEVLKKLVSVGLTEVIMGIQSGSTRIRRDVFHRYETQEDIINATRMIRESGVFWCSYDFMLQHPFETIEDLKESYYLAKEMYGPFELQLHGLNFLPGTDIVPMAIEAGYYTEEEMDAIMYAPMEEQFNAYWKQNISRESDLWYKMIDCLQYKSLRSKVIRFEEDPLSHGDEIDRLYAKAKKLERWRYLYKKSRIALKRVIHI